MHWLSSKTHRFHVGLILLVCLLLTVSLIPPWLNFANYFGRPALEGLEISKAYLPDINEENPALLSLDTFIPGEPATKYAFGNKSFWLLLHLRNNRTESANYRALLDNTTVDLMHIHEYRNSQWQRLATLGDRAPDVSRDQRSLPNIRLSFNRGEGRTLLINVRTNGSLVLPVRIITEQDYHRYLQALSIIWGAFLGVVALMSLYNLILYSGVRDVTYLHYVSYLLSLLLLLGVIYGFGYLIIPESIQLFLSNSIVTLQTMCLFWVLVFSARFLRITPSDSELYSLYIASSTSIVFFCIASLFMKEQYAAPAFGFVQLFSYMVIIRLIAYRFTTRLRWTRYYMISWLPLLAGAAISFGVFSGLVGYSFYTRYAFFAGTLAEMTLISLALADRLGEAEYRQWKQSTHDDKTGLPNKVILEQFLDKNRLENNIGLFSVHIQNYEKITAYLSATQQTMLIQQLERFFLNSLSQHSRIFAIEPDKPPGGALISTNIIVFALETDNIEKLLLLLKIFSSQGNTNPIPKIVPYQIQCEYSAMLTNDFPDSTQQIINAVYRGIDHASERSDRRYLYRPGDSSDNPRKIILAQALDQAIKDNQLHMVYQPKCNLEKSEYHYCEVLVRWNHPSLGTISPDEIIAVAEETGLIQSLTLWVINEAFEHFQKLKQYHSVKVAMAINISAHDLSRRGFFLDVSVLKRQHSIPAEQITFEVTETTHFLDYDTFQSNLVQLKNFGFRLAIDDFGTGYSSLIYVNDHPFDELKIDQSFITHMLTVERQKMIVTTTLDMAQQLGLAVTAEGVEDKETFEALQSMGCDFIQGYYYARPMPFNALFEWLTSAAATQMHR